MTVSKNNFTHANAQVIRMYIDRGIFELDTNTNMIMVRKPIDLYRFVYDVCKELNIEVENGLAFWYDSL